METSILLAKIFGLMYIVIGLGILVNKVYYQTTFNSVLKNTAFMMYGGILSLVVGFVIVTFHNLWVGSWVVIITIIGWLALIKGVLLLLVPKAMPKLAEFWLKNMLLTGILVLILGLVLGYFGFIV